MALWLLVVIPVVMIIPTARIVYWFEVGSLRRAMVIAYSINLALIVGIMTVVSLLRTRRST